MEYKIINKSGPVSKMKLQYQCPHCSMGLKNPIDEAGTKDSCPECGGEFVVPGKSAYEKLSHRELESKMKLAADEVKLQSASEAPMPSVAPHLKTMSKKSRSKTGTSHKINHWLAEAVGSLNALFFVVICILGVVISFVTLSRAEGITDYWIACAQVIAAIFIGIGLCGFIALICSIQSDLNILSKKGD